MATGGERPGGAGSGPGAGGAEPSRPRDRRATHRAAIEIPAVLDLGTREVHCTIRDLSVQGIALSLKESIPPGMVVRVVFRLPNARQPVEVTSVLVRASGGREEGRVGLQFVQPNADSVRAIETFVARNRTDRPFSGATRGGRAPAEAARQGSGDSLSGLYRKAVDEVATAEKRQRGFFARWRRGGKS